MYFDKYLLMLRWEAGIGPRALRVRDNINRDGCYDVILIPQEMDEETGVTYLIESDLEEIRDRLILTPHQFAVLGAWTLSELIKGAMYIEDTVTDYFESEV